MHITIMKLAMALLVSTITTTSGWAPRTVPKHTAEYFEIQDGNHEGNGVYCKYFIKESVLLKNCTKLVTITNVPINEKFDGTETWTDMDYESEPKERFEASNKKVTANFLVACLFGILVIFQLSQYSFLRPSGQRKWKKKETRRIQNLLLT